MAIFFFKVLSHNRLFGLKDSVPQKAKVKAKVGTCPSEPSQTGAESFRRASGSSDQGSLREVDLIQKDSFNLRGKKS